jgi:hypothetical protein
MQMSVVREPQLVIADTESIAVVNRLALDTTAAKLHAIGATHVDHVVSTVRELHDGVLARYVWVLDREIARLLATPNDEAVLVNNEPLPAVINIDTSARRHWAARWCGCTCGRSCKVRSITGRRGCSVARWRRRSHITRRRWGTS